MSPLPHDSRLSEPATRLRLVVFGLLSFSTLAAAGSGALLLLERARVDAETKLNEINLAHVQELDIWRRTQLAAAELASGNPLLARAFTAALAGDPQATQDLAGWTQDQRRTHGWSDIRFFDRHLKLLDHLGWTEGSSRALTELPQMSDDLRKIDRPLLTDIHPRQTMPASTRPVATARSRPLHIGVLAPLKDPDAAETASIGLLILGKDPRHALFPLLNEGSLQAIDAKSWLIDIGGEVPRLLASPPTRDADRSDSTSADFGSELSGRPELQSRLFMRELTDLAGRRAFAVAASVPRSQWLVVTTAPVARLLAPARLMIGIMVALLGLVALTLFAANRLLILRERSKDYLRRYQGEREQRELVERLRDRDKQLQVFFNDAFTGMAVASAEARWERVNPVLAELVGCEPADLTGRECTEIFCAEDRAGVGELLEDFRRGIRQDAEKDARLRRRGGSLLPVRIAIHGIRDTDRSLKLLLIQIDDIRDRLEAEQLYDVLINTSIDGFWILDQAGCLLEVNASYCRISGYSRDELLGRPAAQLGGDEAQGQALMQRLLSEQSEYFEATHRRKDGTLISVEVSTSYSRLQGGRFYAFLRDVTDRKRIEQALALERAQLHSLFDGIDAVLYVADLETHELLYANASFAGALPEQPIGQPCYQVMHKRTSPCPFCTNTLIKNREAPGSLVWQFHDQGRGRWYRCADKGIRWSDGRLVRFEIASDITAQKNNDQRALQLEKLSSLGQLTAGLAHELNNPLMGVINAIQFCLDDGTSVDDTTPVLRDAETQTRRCIAIVRELLAFSRQQGDGLHAFRQVDPQPIIQRVVRLLKYRFDKEQIRFEFDLDSAPTELRLQPERFEQVMINLLANAIDAVSGQPERHIRLRLCEQEDATLLELTDSGPGVPLAVQRRVFEPFFTTKAPGKGTGLGLSTSWSIIADHGGTLDFTSSDGQGTCVTARLPRARPPTPASASPSSTP